MKSFCNDCLSGGGDHMPGCPGYEAPPDPPMRRPRCTCHLAAGPAETVAAELHDEDCALYLAALAAEELGAAMNKLQAMREGSS